MKQLKRTKQLAINETTIFACILTQRELIKRACKDTTSARRAREKTGMLSIRTKEKGTISDSESQALLERITPYKVEVWE